jgi:hypothetical protein
MDIVFILAVLYYGFGIVLKIVEAVKMWKQQ